MENFFLTFTFLVFGLILRRIPVFPKETGAVLNLFVIYVPLPALILLKVPELSFSKELLVPALMPWLMLTVSALLITGLGHIFNWQRQVTGAMLLLVPLGNTAFLGFPMVKTFLGEDGMPYAIIYDQLGTFLALATYGSLVLAFYGEGSRQTPWQTVKRVLTFPPFIAFCLGLLASPFAYPDMIDVLLNSLASVLVPVVMIAIGYQLSFRLASHDLKPLVAGLGIKLIAAPAIALLVCRLFNIETLAGKVAVFEAGMPPMVTGGAMAIMAGLAPRLAAALVGIGILVSFITLPLLYQII